MNAIIIDVHLADELFRTALYGDRVYPVLIQIGPFTIHTYGFLIAVGFLLALWLAVRQAEKEGIAKEPMLDMGFYVIVAALVGSRLLFVATNWGYYARNPLDILKIWEGGLVFFGGLILAVPTAVYFARSHALAVWKVADVWAPSIAIGHAVGRLGCFCAGCCYGKPAEGLPWAVVFTRPESLAIKGVPLHPTQLYESAAEFMNFLLLITLRKRLSVPGQLFWVYIFNYSIIRAVVENFRGDEVRGFIAFGVSISQGISIVLFILSTVMLLRLGRKAMA
jgi:phosphatidylglycerol:prolipoprotein diacylglycerol transferase